MGLQSTSCSINGTTKVHYKITEFSISIELLIQVWLKEVIKYFLELYKLLIKLVLITNQNIILG
jgi:histidinol phosphatase-like enzyme